MTTITAPRKATLYRMVTDKYVCPHGLKSKDLLQRQGGKVEDKWGASRGATDVFKAERRGRTSPQTFIDGQRVGGYDDLRCNFGKSVPHPKATSYTAVVALFGMTALMALAASYSGYGGPFTLRVAEKFAGFSMAAVSSMKARFPFYRRCTC